LRHVLPVLFTSDADVAELVAKTLPVTAAFQLFDAFSTVSNGILRGLGRQDVGGIISLVVYYIVGLPISFSLGFTFHWDLYGLWAGVALGLVLSGIITAWFIVTTDWQEAVDAAVKRNEAG